MLSFRRPRRDRALGYTADEVLAALSSTMRERALTHSSLARRASASYERLEYLGDAVLGLAASHLLFETYEQVPEGDLSKVRAALVSRRVCAMVAGEVGLVDAFQAAARKASSDRGLVRQVGSSSNVHADLVESVIGAVYLEHGYETAAAQVREWFEPHVAAEFAGRFDAKSKLQELAQARGVMAEYETVAADGPDHDRIFEVEVRIPDLREVGVGRGSSRKAAEQAAAADLLDQLGT